MAENSDTSSTEDKPTEYTSSTEDSEDTHEYPSLWKLALIIIGLALAVFCMALDNSILATAIPHITDEFQSLDDVGWYGSSYLLTNCSMTLVFGKLYTFYSTKVVVLGALAVFEVGSVICGAATSSLALIIGRSIAGLGSAGILSGTMQVIVEIAPLEQRPICASLVTGLYGVASVTGPLLGGAFTDYLTWRWCFYINLPIGAVTIFFIVLMFKTNKPPQPRGSLKEQIIQMDLLGLFFFLPGTICLLLALQWGGTQYPLADGRVIGLFVTAGALLLIFIAIQSWRKDQATIPPRLISNRNIWAAACFAFFFSASYMVFVYYMPIWFQSIKNVSATRSGVMNLPMILGVVISAILSGGLVTKFGYYTPFMYIAPVIAAIGAGVLSTLNVDSGSPEWIGYQALYGLGIGLGTAQPIMVVQGALATEDIPSGTAIVVFTQSMGSAIFVSVAQTVFRNQLLRSVRHEAPDIDAQRVITAGAATVQQTIGPDDLPGVLSAYNEAITRTFYVGAALAAVAFLAALPIEWISMKRNRTRSVSK